ncbi:spermatogenesis-defective protein 39 homolog [Schistocerca serialis cubense]|uniref:spermatogenesis-defective protein 39 homolog n=1 Tax=Schistocerca serialis cubense TaxID=2023355 RepID=UPI00214F32AF|nr:spermatogenesis-defective protein 39 homolog [Schistocerca serialis cubense]
MATRIEDEDYWNDSETSARAKAFNFEDEDSSSQLCGVSRSGTARLSQQVRAEIGQDGSCFDADSISGMLSKISAVDPKKSQAAPLLSLISEQSLNCILDAGKQHSFVAKGSRSPEEELQVLRKEVEDHWTPLPVRHTITKMLLGQRYSLELYRSLDSKKELLDEAIALGDGNAVLAVVLFLVHTLKKSLFYSILATRPAAVSQYVQYLTTRMEVQELTDLLTMLGQNREAAMKQFHLAVRYTSNVERKIQKLRFCAKNYFITDGIDRRTVLNYVQLLEWQQAVSSNENNIINNSVLDSLAYVCKHYWDEPKGNLFSPLTLCQQHGISEKQFQWTALTVRASLHAWDDIEALLFTKSWLGGKKLKTAVPVEPLMLKLHELGAPNDVLCKYLAFIDNTGKRLNIARKLQCHRTVIDIFTEQRDRQSLISYKAILDPQSDDYSYAEGALQSSTIKWKN